MPNSSLPQNKSEEVGSSKGVNPKVLFGSILFFGFLALTLGGFKIWRDLRLSGGLPAGAGEPAQAGQENQLGTVTAPQANAQFSTTNEELKTKDTDSDGLSDYDELNVYGTSPYLKDSDGDSYSDKIEIDSNNDPNCPKGTECRTGLPAGAGEPAQTGQENQLGTVSAPQVNAQFTTSDEELKTKDTDSDGLSDYDELNVYGTSPYLKDSDGDSYSDKIEIDSNNDPNCPKGTECRTGLPAQAGQTVPAGSSPQFNELTPPAQGNETATPPTDLSSMTPQELRTLLLATGQVTEDQLKLIDDATLMQMYQETLKEQEQTVQQQGQQP